MRIFQIPSETAEETGCFSVLCLDTPDPAPEQELMLVPAGAQWQEGFTGPVYWLDGAPALEGLPLSRKTLVQPDLADRFPDHPVYLSSRVLAGRLEDRLREAFHRWDSRLWLVVAPWRHIFPLPCPDSQGQPISRTQSAILRSEYDSTYAPDLGCRYCTFLKQQGMVHLFDTRETIEKKLELAERLGVENVVVLDEGM